VDTLVFIIASLLLPAWLLGHLYLTFYPAPETGDSTVAAGSLFGDSGDSSGDSTKTGKPKEGASGSDTRNGKEENESPAGSSVSNPEFDALTEKSTLLQSEVKTLTDSNSQLKAEIERLKTAASNSPATSQADSAAMDELKKQLDSQTSELNLAKQSLASEREQIKNYEQEKQQLQTRLNDLKVKLEQTEADLVAAKEVKSNPSESQADPGSPFAAAPMEEATVATNLLEEQKAKIDELSARVKELSLNLDNTSQTLTQRDEELRKTKLALEDIRVQNGNLKTALEDAKQMAAAPATSSTTAAAPQPAEGNLRLMPREEFRDFVSSKGSVSKMAFIRWEDNDIIVRSFSNKRLYRLTLDRFSEADQQYLLERKK
jgi:predicted nuclease with TOPRIM domain